MLYFELHRHRIRLFFDIIPYLFILYILNYYSIIISRKLKILFTMNILNIFESKKSYAELF